MADRESPAVEEIAYRVPAKLLAAAINAIRMSVPRYTAGEVEDVLAGLRGVERCECGGRAAAAPGAGE